MSRAGAASTWRDQNSDGPLGQVESHLWIQVVPPGQLFSSELPLRHVRRADLVALGKSLAETAEQRVVKLTGDAGRGAWWPDGSNK